MKTGVISKHYQVLLSSMAGSGAAQLIGLQSLTSDGFCSV